MSGLAYAVRSTSQREAKNGKATDSESEESREGNDRFDRGCEHLLSVPLARRTAAGVFELRGSI
jgi:hypothetical protein